MTIQEQPAMYRSLSLAGAVLLAVTACTDDPAAPDTSVQLATKAGGAITVMTRNLYLGGELEPIFTAPAQQVPFAAAQVWAQIQSTDFPRRAGLLADEIVAANPDVVGLQEVITYYVQSPSDGVTGGSIKPVAIRYDFLKLLMDSLAARGAHYTAVARNTNSDVEMPVFTGTGALPFDDVRFVDSDVILARSGVYTYNAQSASYAARAVVPSGGGPITQLRGWSSVDAIVDSVAFRFVNTHLETQGFADVQEQQVTELLAIIGGSSAPVILTGDLNSAADGSQTPTYSRMIGASFKDAWDTSPGFTCCNLPDLTNEQPSFDQRLDLVLTRGFADVKSHAERVGDKHSDRVRSGIWPSDHAGVVARLTVTANKPVHN
jgi:endonuclease/exonuclease/phosphatase family metal-dependent hydrolase